MDLIGLVQINATLEILESPLTQLLEPNQDVPRYPVMHHFPDLIYKIQVRAAFFSIKIEAYHQK